MHFKNLIQFSYPGFPLLGHLWLERRTNLSESITEVKPSQLLQLLLNLMTKFLLHLAESEKKLLREIKKRLQHYCKFIKAFNISAGLVTSYQCLSRGFWYLWRYRFPSLRGLSHREENDKKERESLLSFFSRCGSDRKMSVHFSLRTTHNRRPLFSRLNSGSLNTTTFFFLFDTWY